MEGLLIVIVATAAVIFWSFQFTLLMMMEDELFPGKQDKLIWGITFIFVSPLAPFVFMFWRKTLLQLKNEA